VVGSEVVGMRVGRALGPKVGAREGEESDGANVGRSEGASVVGKADGSEKDGCIEG